jgi:hypothetical protein
LRIQAQLRIQARLAESQSVHCESRQAHPSNCDSRPQVPKLKACTVTPGLPTQAHLPVSVCNQLAENRSEGPKPPARVRPSARPSRGYEGQLGNPSGMQPRDRTFDGPGRRGIEACQDWSPNFGSLRSKKMLRPKTNFRQEHTLNSLRRKKMLRPKVSGPKELWAGWRENRLHHDHKAWLSDAKTSYIGMVQNPTLSGKWRF